MAGMTYSFTAHAKDIFHQDVNCNQLQGLIREAAYVITVSDFNRSFLSDMAPDSAAQIHRVYNGLDLRKYPFRPFGDRPESIVAVGRLVEKKGFDVLIEACRLLRDDGIVVPCRIIGVGDQQTALARQVEALSLVDQISFVGALTHARVIEEVSSASLFAAPCVVGADGNRDGLPTVLLEAMALGTPCISTDVTGIPELLDHQRTGLCVPQRDPRALADAIRLLLSDRALASRLATYARERIEQEFDNAVTGRRIAALHGSVAPISTAAYAGAA
jgi:glycosyltransferase involved in cell wall biosynthesis